MKERAFKCFDSSPQAVTYRAELHGTREASSGMLLQMLQEWVRNGATFSVQFQLLTADSSCDVGISSLAESECSASHDPVSDPDPGESGNSSVPIIIGATIGVILLLAIIAVVIVIVVVRMRHKYDAVRMQDLRYVKLSLHSRTVTL